MEDLKKWAQIQKKDNNPFLNKIDGVKGEIQKIKDKLNGVGL